jgi:hypothetical protein
MRRQGRETIDVNDVQFSDTPLASDGTLTDFCARFPNSPACTRLALAGSGQGDGNNRGNGGGHHHGNRHHDANHPGGAHQGGNNNHHPLS